MKRYALFAGNDYYAVGGWGDFEKASDNLEELLVYAKCHTNLKEWQGFDWAHIVDLYRMEIIYTADGSYCGKVGKGEPIFPDEDA